jgi:choline kinase
MMPLTQDLPKCLHRVGQKTLLDWQLESLRAAGVREIALVRGHLSETISYPGLTYFENPDFRTTNMLHSLFCAAPFMTGGFIVAYSDVLYNPEVVRKLLAYPGEVGLICDRLWRERYWERVKHPVEEAELVWTVSGKVIRIGKGFDESDAAHGEFMGLAKFSPEGAKWAQRVYRDLSEAYRTQPQGAFQQATTFEKAYLTDFLSELIGRGFPAGTTDIEGGVFEIDTPQDYHKAQKVWPSQPLRDTEA